VCVQVTPQFVVDHDGETLVPAPPIQPVFVTSADWPNVVAMVDEAREHLQEQMDGSAP